MNIVRYSAPLLTHCLPLLALPIKNGEFELSSDFSLVPRDKEQVEGEVVSGVVV